MLNQFQSFVKSQLNPKETNFLLAVSGGIDSMVMLHLFEQSGYRFSVAHCNFHLRDEESNQDEQFVKDYCSEHKIKIHINEFDTRAYATKNGISIEMAARDLRYNWFHQLCIQHSFDYICTAHHKNDVAETMLLNLTRGTGLSGLHGIKALNGNVFRPLLFARRQEIEDYAKENNLSWQTDRTNSDTDISRNKIRHQVIPLLETLNPAFVDTQYRNAQYIADAEVLLSEYIQQLSKKIVTKKGDCIALGFDKILKSSQPKALLFELLKPYAFSGQNIEKILEVLHQQPGKVFFSNEYRLVKDRHHLLITKIDVVKNKETVELGKLTFDISHPIALKSEIQDLSEEYITNPDPKIAWFDADKIQLPLTLRKWQQGDYFYPLGLGKKKKISDFFTNKKLSLVDKEKVWILCSGDKIVWVCGLRGDHRFRITEGTKNVVRMTVDGER